MGESNETLIKMIYPELRAMAGRLLQRERNNHTLQRTALVHETLLRLFRSPPSADISPHEFLALSAHQMRHVLIDYARARGSQRRGGASCHLALPKVAGSGPRNGDDLLWLAEALDRLGILDPRLLAVVELKIFSGCTNSETAEILGVSNGTVEQDWRFSRAWLFQELTKTTSLPLTTVSR